MSDLLAAAGLILLACTADTALAQSGSGQPAIIINHDVIESLDDSNNRAHVTSAYPRQETTPWGTSLPGSPYARLPGSSSDDTARPGEQSPAVQPREMPHSTLLLGDSRNRQDGSQATAPRPNSTRQPSTTSTGRSSRQATRSQAPAEPARGKPRSILEAEDAKPQEQVATQPDRDPAAHEADKTQQASAAGMEIKDGPAETRAGDRETKDAPESAASSAGTAASSESSETEDSALAASDSSTANSSGRQEQSDQRDMSESADPVEEGPEEVQGSAEAGESSTATSQTSETQATAAESGSEDTQQASLSDTAEAGEISERTLTFSSESADLSKEAQQQLRDLAARLSQDPSIRIQLLAYAQGSDDDASQARRLSLSRALAVRAYLLDHGTRSTRIDVRALGHNAPGSGSDDRVDIVPVDPEES